MKEPIEVQKFRSNYDAVIKHGRDISITFPASSLKFVIAALLHARSTKEYKDHPQILEALELVIVDLAVAFNKRVEGCR